MERLHKIPKWFHDNHKTILLSAANALTILLLCYIYDNMPFSINGDTTVRQWIERAKSYFGIDNRGIPNDLFIVDVAYDRQLVPVFDEFGFPKGNTDITDRHKLFTFLSEAKKAGNYRYIILDVNFSDSHSTPIDSALFSLITSMDRIVIPKHSDIALANNSLYRKARYSEYSSTILDEDFAKYNYIINSEPSIPLSIYNDITGNKIHSLGFLHFSQGHLCRKCVAPQFKVKAWDEYDDKRNKTVYHLGSDITDLGSLISIKDYIKDKYVVVGDIYERDMHDTYMGPISGAIININALYALLDSAHIINWGSIILLFILYASITATMLFDINITTHIPFINRIKSRTILFLLSFVGFSFILSIFAMASHIVLNAEFNVFIPSLYFSIFNFINNYRNAVKQP